MHPRRFLFALALLASAGAFAQQHRMRMPPPGGGPDGPGDFAFIRAEFGMAGRIVKGAPYSAQVVTHFTQALADGNRIQRTSAGTFARDSEGRTRTERSLAAIGPLAASGDTSTMIFINDPVAAMNYVLDGKNHTARQMQMPADRPQRGPAGPGGPSDWQGRHPQRQSMAVKSDDLGTQVMEGVTVQGKRTTRTVPAGQMGNERAIDIVTETWYSPDLQAVVMSRTSDPRSGESLYKLTNISRAEPDHSLFTVPSDYTVQQGRGPRNNQ